MHGAQRGGASCHSEFVGADDSVRPFPVIPSRCEHWRGNPSPQKRKTDCRVATRREASTLGVLLAMTARRCRADGTSYPKGICSATLHCRTPSPTRGSTYRPVGRGPRAPPKNAYPAAGHMGPALQVHTPQKKQRGAPQGAPRVFRPCVAQTEEGYIRRFYKREPRGCSTERWDMDSFTRMIISQLAAD